MGRIKNMGTATMQFKEGIIVTGSAHNPDGTDSAYSLVVSGSVYVEEDIKLKGKLDVITTDVNNDVAIAIGAGNNDTVAMRFGNTADAFGFNLIYSGSGSGNENTFLISSDGGNNAPNIDILEMDQSGSVKFNEGVTILGSANSDFPSLVVSGSQVISGSGGNVGLGVIINDSNVYATTIKNDQSNSGHVLQLSTDGSDKNSKLLSIDGASQGEFLIVRGDGRMGLGRVASLSNARLVISGTDDNQSDIAVSHKIQHLGDSDTYLFFPANDQMSLYAGGTNLITLEEHAFQPNNVFVNMGLQDTDFVVCGQTNQELFYVDGSSETVGIGTEPDASYNLHISGSSITSVLIGEGGDTSHQSTRESKLLLTADKGNSSVTGSILVQSPGGSFAHDMQVGTLSNHNLEFFTNNTERVVIRNTGNVGINTSDPDYTLDVAGDIGVNQYIYHNGDANTFINFTDNRIRLNAGGTNFIDCEDPGSAPHKVKINNGGNNIDFVIKDNSNNRYFTADASEARIGIGTETPDTVLHVKGTGITNDSADNAVSFIDMYRMDDAVNINDEVMQIRIGAKNIDGSGAAYGGQIVAKSAGAWDSVTHSPTNFLVNLSSNTDLLTTRLFVSASGETGIGTSTPDSKLHIYNSTSANLKLQTGGDSTLIIDSGNGSNSVINLKRNDSNKWNILNNSSNDNLNINSNSGTAITIEQDGDVGIGSGTPIAKLDVAGKIAITAEASTPSQPADGQGYVYSKNDGKLYWRSHDISEVDLTAGANAAGSDDQIMFNNSNTLTGDSQFKFDNNTKQLQVGAYNLAHRLTIAEDFDNQVTSNVADTYAVLVVGGGTVHTGSTGIGFSRTFGGEIGASILHRATDAESKGHLEFHTKGNTNNGGGPSVRFRVNDDGITNFFGGSSTNVASGLNSGMMAVGYSNGSTAHMAFDVNTIQAKAQSTGNGDTLYLNSLGGDVILTTTANTTHVGIGDNSPGSKLHVAVDEASNYVTRFFNNGNDTNRYGIRISCGKDTPSSDGDIRWIGLVDGNGTNISQIQYKDSGDGAQFATLSDRRVKTNIVDSSVNATNIFKNLPIRQFNKIRGGVTGSLDPVGFIAQEVEALIPTIVSESEVEGYDTPLKTLGHAAFIPYLVKAVKELIEVNEQLEARVRSLEG